MQPKNTHYNFLCPSFTGIGHIESLGSNILLLQEWNVQHAHTVTIVSHMASKEHNSYMISGSREAFKLIV